MPSPAVNRVAVVVPMSFHTALTADEQISLRHLEFYLGRYDRFLVLPRRSAFALSGYRRIGFPDGYFGSQAAHRRLMLSRRFYAAFSEYEYILIYHLDALVFSDQLSAWCEAGYDYIGAPWLADRAVPERGFSRVGNGGFSLRRVSSFLRVIDSRAYAVEPSQYWGKYFAHRSLPVRLLNWPRAYLKRFRLLNNVRWELASVTYNEDYFWSDRAVRFDRSFRVAPPEEGLRFAFEEAPRYCFARNRHSLPFGCHGWPRYDRAFWEPYLIREGKAATAGSGRLRD